jgi:hypothetical protein
MRRGCAHCLRPDATVISVAAIFRTEAALSLPSISGLDLASARPYRADPAALSLVDKAVSTVRRYRS